MAGRIVWTPAGSAHHETGERVVWTDAGAHRETIVMTTGSPPSDNMRGGFGNMRGGFVNR